MPMTGKIGGGIESTIKEMNMNDFICSCFEYQESDLADDINRNGYSTIMAEIIEAKKVGECQCAVKNPKGR